MADRLIILTAVFLYKVTVKTGQFDIIRASVVSITEDQRLQMLLVGFSFGAFLEGAAGFRHRSRSPRRCWSVWASTRSTPPACA